YKLHALLAAQAPIDGFGIGTALDISIDAPALDCAYKLQEYAGKPRRKHSEGKVTWPGRKQAYRRHDNEGCIAADVIALEDDDPQPGEALIQPVMRAGKRLHTQLPLAALRDQTLQNYRRLPTAMTALEPAPAYPVAISTAVQALADQVDRDRMLHERKTGG
ncbi:MAG: nicotinate phosphoribosyltransferase, partial [Proteobacteria bacterium]|nr:nicotinate phosphoribosyltransferase [Pseudomonadota bacterium]